jgi:ABC-type transport system involved in multi-copper enzyme maturation permease subunit
MNTSFFKKSFVGLLLVITVFIGIVFSIQLIISFVSPFIFGPEKSDFPPGADKNTFELIDNSLYGKDKDAVYLYTTFFGFSSFDKIEGADPQTFHYWEMYTQKIKILCITKEINCSFIKKRKKILL